MYLYAHNLLIFRGMTSDEATDDVIKIQLPLIDTAMARGDLHVDNIDVFCEQGVFNIVQSKRILEAGKKLGLQINFHGDELHPLGSAEVNSLLVINILNMFWGNVGYNKIKMLCRTLLKTMMIKLHNAFFM